MLNTIIFFMIVISFADQITDFGVFIASDFASIENARAHAHAECTSLFMNFSSFHFETYLQISALCQRFKWRAQNVIYVCVYVNGCMFQWNHIEYHLLNYD